MEVFIYTNKKNNIDNQKFEVVETKGKGHPDNICDTLAEKISANYSNYCLTNYGVIFRHMIDKLSILGGGSVVKFGGGYMISPIKILVNGRFTDRYNNEKIDYMHIVNSTIKEYIKELFPMLEIEKDLVIIDNTHHNEGPGVVYDENNNTKNERKKFFEACGVEDAKKHNNHNKCNDTSTTVSYFPMSKLEQTILNIEQLLNSDEYKKENPWVGNDIKVMGIRKNDDIEITCCVPLITKYVNDIVDYKNKLNNVKSDIKREIQKKFKNNSTKIYLNTRDNFENNDLYLTLTGSAIESGDEGAVGRGNRSRGVIPFSRNFSMEAACGKNPVYHTGKLFTAIGDVISENIYEKYKIQNVVYCTSKMGDNIEEPWNISIELNRKISKNDEEIINGMVNEVLKNHYKITEEIINKEIKLNSY